MNKLCKSIALLSVALVFAGCESRTDKTDSGGVTLSIVERGLLPISVSVADALGPESTMGDDLAFAGFVFLEDVTLANIQKDPSQASSQLQNVELTSYEVKYSRADAGTQLPGTYMQGPVGSVPINGETTFAGIDVMGLAQLTSSPLQDLMLQGQDPETGSDTIALNFELRFFGRTLSGDAVESGTSIWTIQFLP